MLPLAIWGLAYVATLPGALIVWDSSGDWTTCSDYVAVNGRRFPQCAVDQMKTPGKRIHPGDFLSYFWGGLTGGDGDLLVVWAREGLLTARGDSRQGYMVAARHIPQYAIIYQLAGLSTSLYLFLLAFRPQSSRAPHSRLRTSPGVVA